jgi:hypothetical protein
VARYGLDAANVGDEGGFAPPCESFEAALDLLVAAIEGAGYTGKVKVGGGGRRSTRRVRRAEGARPDSVIAAVEERGVPGSSNPLMIAGARQSLASSCPAAS